MLTFEEALSLNRETSQVDFKNDFDVSSKGDWCELIKDIAAMANTGGGIIAIGLDDGGDPTGIAIDEITKLDPADIANKISAYTDEHFAGAKLIQAEKAGIPVVLMQIDASEFPIVFKRPGTYAVSETKQQNAFSAGSVYFRHGAKSEPCRAKDLRNFVERQVTSVKDYWLSGIAQVVEAEKGSHIIIQSPAETTEIQISDDPHAPVTRLEEKELMELFPLDYQQLTSLLRERYSDFVLNGKYWSLKKEVEQNSPYCHARYLNPRNQRGNVKKFYSPNITNFFDRHYTRKATK